MFTQSQKFLALLLTFFVAICVVSIGCGGSEDGSASAGDNQDDNNGQTGVVPRPGAWNGEGSMGFYVNQDSTEMDNFFWRVSCDMCGYGRGDTLLFDLTKATPIDDGSTLLLEESSTVMGHSTIECGWAVEISFESETAATVTFSVWSDDTRYRDRELNCGRYHILCRNRNGCTQERQANAWY